jgi:hypothetical protein
MTELNSIAATLADLISFGNVQSKVMLVIGEMIAIDARISSHDLGTNRPESLEKWEGLAEAYDRQLVNTQNVVNEFKSKRSGQKLLEGLERIRADIAKL